MRLVGIFLLNARTNIKEDFIQRWFHLDWQSKPTFSDGSETSDRKRIMPQQENGRNKGHGFSSAIIIALGTV